MRGRLAVLALLLLVATAPTALAVASEGARDDWTWTLVDPRGVAIGGGGLDADDVRYVHDQGFRAILSYRAQGEDDAATIAELGMGYLVLPNTYAESDTMPLEHVHMAVAFLEENLAAGRPVYVHCTGGWHRSAVAAVALMMKENGWRFDEAWAHVAAERPGIEPRYMDVLLAYEAELFDEEKLTLDLTTERWDVEPGERIELTASVTHDGEPVAGARVEVAVEVEGAGVLGGSTDEGGTARFAVEVPGGSRMRYVHARASRAGFVDGYDRNVYWVGEAKRAPPTRVELPSDITAKPGGSVALRVRVFEGDDPTNARVTITSACGTHWRAYTGWDGRVDVDFAAPGEGVHDLRVHVGRFPAEPVVRDVRLVVGDESAPAACGTAPAESTTAAIPVPSLLATLSVVAAALLTARRRAR